MLPPKLVCCASSLKCQLSALASRLRSMDSEDYQENHDTWPRSCAITCSCICQQSRGHSVRSRTHVCPGFLFCTLLISHPESKTMYCIYHSYITDVVCKTKRMTMVAPENHRQTSPRITSSRLSIFDAVGAKMQFPYDVIAQHLFKFCIAIVN